jgi:hypothetical protein
LVKEVRGIRTDFASLSDRLDRQEGRLAEVERRNADLESAVGALKQTVTAHGLRLGMLEQKAGIDGGPSGT